MDGDEALQSTRRSEPLHHPLSFSKGQMAVFSAVVEPLVGPMFKAGRDLAFSCTVGAQLICNDPFWHETPAFHRLDQKSLCRALVSLGLQNFFKNDAVLIHSPPQLEGPARDLHDDFVQMPDIAGTRLPTP